MNNLQAISKCRKKAWEEIKIIQSANNMLEIEQAISNAVEKTFGFWNKGLLLIRMKKLGQMGEFEHAMRIRRTNFDNWQSLIRAYLVDMIPARFNNTLMYRRVVYGVSNNCPVS